MKPVTQSQFATLTEKRLNMIARALKDHLGTADNNPEHLSDDMIDKVEDFLTRSTGAFVASLRAIAAKPKPSDIGEFSLGGEKKKTPRPLRARTEAKPTPVPLTAPEPVEVEVEDLDDVIEEGEATQLSAPKPADDEEDILAGLEDLD
ncbi:hypothetical protein [Azospirillum argentinense]|uniref:hypothetical protein n=1 Tax=Azospirillum argentinense TaxID=2970906 RepID=UPI0032DE8401